ncbi:MAG: porin, partial [Bacteroidetes bacterium]
MQSKIRLSLLLLLLFVSINYSITAQEKQADTLSKPLIRYGDKGFELSSANNNYFMHIEWRGQFRISYPTDTDPITLNDFEGNKIHMYINRARIKVGGHSYQSWLKYYLEYELAGSYLLDFRLMIEKFPFLKIKIGQWKVQYNRERIISSGKQQTAERSILTRQFTIDRQQGLSLFGHLKAEGIADFNYWISALMGTGRGNESNDDHHLMYMMRLQWNFMGEPLKFEGSDLDYHKKFAAIIAVGLVTNQSQYTRFSSSGGG